MIMRHLRVSASFLFALSLSACSGGGSSVPSAVSTLPTGAPAIQSDASRNIASVGNSAAAYTAVDAGSAAASGAWMADADHYGGLTSTVAHTIKTSGISNPAPQSVYQSQRWGTAFSYVIPNLTPNRLYTIRLHFAESVVTAAGKRVFDVAVNGLPVLTKFDIFAAAGGANIGIVKVVTASADSRGAITIGFAASVMYSSVAGIEVIDPTTASPGPAVRPGIAIDAGGSAVGGWVADTEYNGGWVSAVSQAIDTSRTANAAPQVVYQSQRVWSNLTYTVPNLTPGGAYYVRLHFAETWATSAGKRLFNVTVNGARVLTNFDIFQAAGGANIAVVKQFASTADASGKITVGFAATVNNASVGGIEIAAASGVTLPPATAAPTAPPRPIGSSTPIGSATCVTSGNPIYSGCYTGNTPFHHTVAELQAKGAASRGQGIANNYWAQGLGNSQITPTAIDNPFYISHAGDPAYNVTCNAYGDGSRQCNAATAISGKQIHLPVGAAPQSTSDHHIIAFDFTSGVEVDLWGGNGGPGQQCQVGTWKAGTLSCSWGGVFPFAGSGLATGGSSGFSGDAGGYAFGLMDITAQELLNGHIGHALGIGGSCLDNGGVYPSIVGRASDYTCGGHAPTPTARYGDMIHLKSSVDITKYGYSKYCLVIVRALQEYGAYTADNAPYWGISLEGDDFKSYGSNNPWYNVIMPSMAAGGDAHQNGSNNFDFNWCLNRLAAGDLEVLQISTNLP